MRPRRGAPLQDQTPPDQNRHPPTQASLSALCGPNRGWRPGIPHSQAGRRSPRVAGAASSDAQRPIAARVARDDLFQHNIVMPVVAEITDVQEAGISPSICQLTRNALAFAACRFFRLQNARRPPSAELHADFLSGSGHGSGHADRSPEITSHWILPWLRR